MDKRINLKTFIKYYSNFIKIPTWTTEKHTARDKLYSYLDKYESVGITTKVYFYGLHYLNEFTIIRVEKNKTGYLKPYRNELVVIVPTYRFGYNFYVGCFPLKEKKISSKVYESINAFGEKYVEQVDFHEMNILK